MTREEASNILDDYDVNFEGHTAEEIAEAFEVAFRALEQENCQDEYIKVPKKALKYRTAGMVGYNAEWLKNHFDIERAVICGAQKPCEDWYDVPSDEMTLEQARQAVKDLRKKLAEYLEQEPCDVFDKYGNYKYPNDVELTEPNTATSMPCEDAISRKNIIAFLNGLISDDTERKKALKYVNELPPVNPQPCDNVISRQAVLDIVDSYSESQSNVEDVTQDIISDIVALSPVNPQSKMGRWRHYEGVLRCSECGAEFYDDIMEYCGDDAPKWCPDCETKMIEPQESEETDASSD